jgi:uncharacterized protein
VRRLLLVAQGLTTTPQSPSTRSAILPAVRRMKALQIDTIHVVARSPYLVLWSRLGDYAPAWLDELLAEGDVFEYWAHAACFLPREHYGYYRRWMLDKTNRIQKHTAAWLAANRALGRRVLARIRDEGPLRSADFERQDGRKGGGWWDWKAEKMALEVLFTLGKLLVARRQNFQRVYDLTERVRPDWQDRLAPPADKATRHLIRASVEALGVAKPEWVAEYLFLNQPKRPIAAMIRRMAKDGELVEVAVDDWTEPGYALPGWVEEHLEQTAQPAVRTTLLSPFDPVCWDRARLSELFGFDYQIECYTPQAKRRYGYFTLPILHGDRIVGRLDPKAHRRDGVMEVKALHLEPGVKPTADLVEGLKQTLAQFAAWHGTPEVVVRNATAPRLAKALETR